MLSFIIVHGEKIPLELLSGFTDEELKNVYFDLKTEQVAVQGKLGDLRIDENYDRVRESGLCSASRHIALGIEYVQDLRKARREKTSDRFMDQARKILDPDLFNLILDKACAN